MKNKSKTMPTLEKVDGNSEFEFEITLKAKWNWNKDICGMEPYTLYRLLNPDASLSHAFGDYIANEIFNCTHHMFDKVQLTRATFTPEMRVKFENACVEQRSLERTRQEEELAELEKKVAAKKAALRK